MSKSYRVDVARNGDELIATLFSYNGVKKLTNWYGREEEVWDFCRWVSQTYKCTVILNFI